MSTIVITGGAGFIGSHVVRRFVCRYPEDKIINVDLLTYAGNLANLRDIEGAPNYRFVKMDIGDYDGLLSLFREEHVDGVIHLAAESHVDRSIRDPFTFVRTNVLGTCALLHAAQQYWEQRQEGYNGARFYHISTDEVYGTLALDCPAGRLLAATEGVGAAHTVFGTHLFTESTRYSPHSPYSASKASSDHLVRAYHDTYGMPTLISNCSNNYGPYQFPEKLIPLCINNIRRQLPLPIYGKGENVRDWLYVEDHAAAIDLIYHRGRVGETYNIGGNNEQKNIALVRRLIATTDALLGHPAGYSLPLITYVTDRPGHDARYAIDGRKVHEELGWHPSFSFEEGLARTVRWYLDNDAWLDNVTSGEYQKYYDTMYHPQR